MRFLIKNIDIRQRFHQLQILGIATVFQLLFVVQAVSSFEGNEIKHYRSSCNIDIRVRKISLSEILNYVSHTCGYATQVTDLGITINSQRVAGEFRSVIDYLATQNNFVWFIDGKTVVISPLGETTIKTIYLPGFSEVQVKDALSQAGLMNVDSAIQFLSDGAVRLTGPVNLVSRIESVIAGLRRTPEAEKAIDVIRFGQTERAIEPTALPLPVSQPKR